METVLLMVASVAAVALLLAGTWLERRRNPGVIRPLAARPVDLVAAPVDVVPAAPSMGGLIGRWRRIVARHPAPFWGWVETIFWLLVLSTVFFHLRDVHDGLVARIVWLLTIGPHEIGHIICMPFGWTLHFAGGSIWQVLWWLLLALYVLFLRFQVTGALVFMTIVGHSFINMMPYIADARARELPLLFGMDSSHHDWWNLLNKYRLLEYDQQIADFAAGVGVTVLLLTAAAGIITTWLLPRRGIGPVPRYMGNLLAALRAGWRGEA